MVYLSEMGSNGLLARISRWLMDNVFNVWRWLSDTLVVKDNLIAWQLNARRYYHTDGTVDITTPFREMLCILYIYPCLINLDYFTLLTLFEHLKHDLEDLKRVRVLSGGGM